MEKDPDSRNYWSEEHRLWLPKGHGEAIDPPDEEAAVPAGSARSPFPVAYLIAVAIAAVLIVLILIFLRDVIPSPLPELIATVPIAFIDLAARTIERRRLEWPSLQAFFGPRPWYITGIGYGALLVIVSLVEGALLQAVGGNLGQLVLINIVTGVAMGVWIAWRFGPHGRPVLTIIEAAFVAGLLGVLFDLILLGREGSGEVHGGAAPLYLVIMNGLLFAGTGLVGYLGLSVWRRLRPPRLLLSPDRKQVWDGSAWRPVESDGRTFLSGRRRVPFRPEPNPPVSDDRGQ